MYSKIEKDFKAYEQSSTLDWIIIISLIISIPVFAIILWNATWIAYVIMTLIYSSVILVSAYLWVFFYLRKYSKDKTPWRSFLKFVSNTKKYQKLLHDNDINLLKEILDENKVNTKEKRLIAIQHYQSLIPRNINSGGTALSILAFAVSVLALILNETFLDNIKVAIVIFVLIVMICFLAHMVNKHILQSFGKVELYKRLENSITEIYINTPDEETRVLKKPSLRKHKYPHK